MACDTDDSRVSVMLRRCYVFLLLCFQIVLCFAEIEATIINKGTFNTFDQHEGDITKSKIRSLKLISNATTGVIELRDKGRFLKVYNLVTCDGYILNVFRMTFQNNETNGNKFPVLLAHGLYQSSDRFIEQRNEQNLAFLLQNLGYDVWLANTRGNKYGRHHIYLEPDTENLKFFNYSYEEIALDDIPLIIDYILNDTSKEKVHYIGHSLGATVFLVLNSLKPEYNKKFATAHLLAPIGYQNFFPDNDLAEEARQVDKIYGELMNQGKAEIFPYANNVLEKNENESLGNVQFSVEDCLGDKTYQSICRKLKMDKFMNLNSPKNSINKTRGGSIKLLAHLAQNIKSKTFSRWDYGEKENEKYYGTKESPKYNLGLINAATKIIYAPNDEYVSVKDITDMAKDMANTTTIEVARKDFKHEDFIVASDAMESVYTEIIKDLRNNNRLKRNTELKRDVSEKNLSKEQEDVHKENDTDEDDEDNIDEEPEIKQEPKQRRPKRRRKFRVAKTNQKLFIPTSWWLMFIFWLPKVIIPITICICLILFFCCLKKINTNFAVTLKNEKDDDE